MSWSPDQYLKFARPRLRPAIDLLQRVALTSPGRIYDLGCGAGNVTALMAARWPAARISGVDSSASMLAQAARTLPGVQWCQQSIDQWRPEEPADLIYSNAALQWLPHHERLFPALMSCLQAGGVLAVQMPRNFDAPSHTLIVRTAREGPWRERLEPLLQCPPAATHTPAFYYDLLAPWADSLEIWETQYLHALSGENPVEQWTRGTALVPYLEILSASEQRAFEQDYARRLRSAYPPRADGITLFAFRRLFLVLRKAAIRPA